MVRCVCGFCSIICVTYRLFCHMAATAAAATTVWQTRTNIRSAVFFFSLVILLRITDFFLILCLCFPVFFWVANEKFAICGTIFIEKKKLLAKSRAINAMKVVYLFIHLISMQLAVCFGIHMPCITLQFFTCFSFSVNVASPICVRGKLTACRLPHFHALSIYLSLSPSFLLSFFHSCSLYSLMHVWHAYDTRPIWSFIYKCVNVPSEARIHV